MNAVIAHLGIFFHWHLFNQIQMAICYHAPRPPDHPEWLLKAWKSTHHLACYFKF